MWPLWLQNFKIGCVSRNPETKKYWDGIQQSQGIFLALDDHPSSDGLTIKIHYVVDVSLH